MKLRVNKIFPAYWKVIIDNLPPDLIKDEKSIFLGILFLLLSYCVPAQQVSMIIHNARLVTLDENNPKAQAVAISNDRIVLVGSDEEVLKMKRPSTRIFNAKGRTLIPGLFDSHLHVIRAGRFYNMELRWDGVTTLKRALQMLKDQAMRTPDGQWVRVVGGWNEYQFKERRLPTLDEINAATGNVPTFILYLYGHAYVNKAGLRALRLNDTTPNPPGGLIQKDADGQPTGLLVAEPSAFILYSTLSKLPELTQAEKLNSTRHFASELNRLGVTSVMDAGGGFQNFPDDYVITDSLAKLGLLTLRLPYYLFAQKGGSELSDYRRWITMVDIDHSVNTTYPTEYGVQGGGENLVATGADFENFNKPRPELSAAMENQLKQVLTLLIKNRWPFRLHATYNETISRFLDVIEEVQKETPLNNLTWFFDHAETISDENLVRVKALKGGIAIQHRMAYQGESFIARYGLNAARHTPPVRKMLQMGIPVGLGTDGTRVASYNPWIALYWLVSGKTIGGKEYMAPENKLDRLTALKLFTQGSASLIKQESDRGIIKPGCFADLALLSDDYLNIAEEKIKNIHSVLTILDGKVVFGDQEFSAYATPLPKAIPSWSPNNFYGGYQYE